MPRTRKNNWAVQLREESDNLLREQLNAQEVLILQTFDFFNGLKIIYVFNLTKLAFFFLYICIYITTIAKAFNAKRLFLIKSLNSM